MNTSVTGRQVALELSDRSGSDHPAIGVRVFHPYTVQRQAWGKSDHGRELSHSRSQQPRDYHQ